MALQTGLKHVFSESIKHLHCRRRVKDAPGGAQYLSASATVLDRGKEVFADRCARCHSSKLPIPAQGLDLGGCAGPHYLACWNRYWEWTKTDDFKQKMRQIVKAPDFLDGNYLSTEFLKTF